MVTIDRNKGSLIIVQIRPKQVYSTRLGNNGCNALLYYSYELLHSKTEDDSDEYITLPVYQREKRYVSTT